MARLIFLSFLICLLSVTYSSAQKRAERTSSAQAAYGRPVSFKSHVKKNKKSKQKAKKSAKRRELRNNREGYRKGMPI